LGAAAEDCENAPGLEGAASGGESWGTDGLGRRIGKKNKNAMARWVVRTHDRVTSCGPWPMLVQPTMCTVFYSKMLWRDGSR
jgi:hypothetical protein